MICIIRSDIENNIRSSETKTCSPADALVSLLLREVTCAYVVTALTATRLVLESDLCGYRSETVVTGLPNALLPVLKGLYLGINPPCRTAELRKTGVDSPWKHAGDLESMDELVAKMEATVYRRYRLRAVIMAAFGMTDVDAIRSACLL